MIKNVILQKEMKRRDMSVNVGNDSERFGGIQRRPSKYSLVGMIRNSY